MNALLRPGRRLLVMGSSDLDEVMLIEQAAYAFPWTRGNFADSLHSGYLARLLRNEQGALLGYFVAMNAVDEMHLLNLTVAPSEQGQGHARWMLEGLVAHCRRQGAVLLWLEVRTGNTRARALYERHGFREIGARRAYYPAGLGRREDAVVMSLATGASLASKGAGSLGEEGGLGVD